MPQWMNIPNRASLNHAIFSCCDAGGVCRTRLVQQPFSKTTMSSKEINGAKYRLGFTPDSLLENCYDASFSPFEENFFSARQRLFARLDAWHPRRSCSSPVRRAKS